MLNKHLKGIAILLQENNIILKKEVESYKNGFLLLISNMLTTLGIFIIGYYMNLIGVSVLLSVALVTVRTFAGSNLDNSYLKYCIYSLSTYLIIIGLYIFIPTELKIKLSPICLLISALIIYKSTIGKNKENPIFKGKRERIRVMSKIILIGALEASIIFNRYIDVVFLISCILLNISINTVIDISSDRKNEAL